MQLHNLQPHTSRTTSRRVGRGGKRGKTAGRGTKGQKARAGHRIRPEVCDTIKKIPKLRGHGINRSRTVNDATLRSVVVNVAQLDEKFNDGEAVNPVSLKERGLVSMPKGKGKATLKILGDGALSKKLTISGCTLSASAREKIEKAGGKIA